MSFIYRHVPVRTQHGVVNSDSWEYITHAHANTRVGMETVNLHWLHKLPSVHFTTPVTSQLLTGVISILIRSRSVAA